jgi:hypothetical protein
MTEHTITITLPDIEKLLSEHNHRAGFALSPSLHRQLLDAFGDEHGGWQVVGDMRLQAVREGQVLKLFYYQDPEHGPHAKLPPLQRPLEIKSHWTLMRGDMILCYFIGPLFPQHLDDVILEANDLLEAIKIEDGFLLVPDDVKSDYQRRGWNGHAVWHPSGLFKVPLQ